MLDDAAAVLHGRAHRLLHQAGHPGVDDISEDGCMGHVGRGDHHGIAQAGIQQRPVVGELGDGDSIAEGQAGPLERFRVRVSDRYDLGSVNGLEVSDVLQAHHPGADDADANWIGCAHRSIFAAAQDCQPRWHERCSVFGEPFGSGSAREPACLGLTPCVRWLQLP